MDDKNVIMQQLFNGLDDNNKNLLLIIAKTVDFAQAVNQDTQRVG